ncbi:MAG TPA: hypothetical protein PLI95_27400, partial [Polyangiaceae bacterium]|nr:hypothetical protein [Polyangiaceae bacterium]
GGKNGGGGEGDAGGGGATLDASDETSEASAKACSVDPLPAIGEYTPDYEPLTACTCAPGDNPACHGLFQARVVEVSADGWHATLEIKKANGQQISEGLLYWVVVGDEETDCNLLNAYVVRAEGTVSASGASFTVSDVPIWPDQSTFESDTPGASKYIFVVTDGAGSKGLKTWFQRDPTKFTKLCAP